MKPTNEREIGPAVARNFRQLNEEMLAGDLALQTQLNQTITRGTSFPASPVTGQLFVNSSTRRIWQWSGTSWIIVGGPTPGVRARITGAANLLHNTITATSWTNEDYDTDGFHHNVTNNSRLTVPAALGGLYHVGYTTSIGAGGNVVQSWVSVNGASGNRFAHTQDDNSAASGYFQSASDFLVLAAGDYVECFMYQNSGGTLPINGSVNINSFWMYRVGPA